MGDIVSSLFKSKDKNNAKDQSVEQWHYDYNTVKGYFLQDSSTTHPGSFDAMKQNFGLIDQDYDTDRLLPANGKDLTQWQRFANKLKVMNEKAADGTSYRLLYLGRHGQGYHNVASQFYGDNAWDCYYSTLDDDPHVPNITFFDAHLTLLGKHQAKQVSDFWTHQLQHHHTPAPQTYYSSPHTRAIQTATISFNDVPLPATQPFTPLIKELLREGYGIHTCDRRASKTYLETEFPDFAIESGFSERDELFDAHIREPPAHHIARLTRLLDDVFAHDDSTYISMTSHSGTIAAMLSAVRHRAFLLLTGGVIPVLVKVIKVVGPRPDDGSSRVPWEGKPDCTRDPLTAGKKGYKNIAEFLKEIDRSVPKT